MDAETPFDPSRAIRALLEYEVAFVVAGGLAAILLGSPTFADELEVCYARSPTNLEALGRALRSIQATCHGGQGPSWTVDALGDSSTFDTEAGPVRCSPTPSSTGGYPDLLPKATRFRLDDLEFAVVSLDDLIRMKRAAGRPKDRIELEILGALRDQIDGEPP